MSSVPVEPGFRASLEKGETAQLEQALSSRSEESIDEDPEFSPAEQRKIIHKVDRRLIVTCGLMYCISLMDRTNLSAAAIAGMTKELKLIDFRYVSGYGRFMLNVCSCSIVHNCIGVLRNICRLPATSDRPL